MANIIKSQDMGWLDSSDVFYNVMHPDVMAERLSSLVETIHKAQRCLNNADGLSSFICTITTNDTEELVANLRRFVYFCNGIHYEISELVDTPFSTKMGSLAEEVIALNPSDYRYVASKFLFIDNYMTLADLVQSTIEDKELKASFRDLAMELDEDVVSFELQDSIKEANWWQEQFVIAEQIDEATDEFFTPEVRKKWPSMTVEERDTYIQEYKEILDRIYFGGETRVLREVEYLEKYKDDDGNWVQPGYGLADSFPNNYVAININFKTNPTGMYSIDKMIDTMTHEMRHRYQDLNTSEMSNNMIDEWNQEYISSKVNYDRYYRQPVEEDAKAFAALAQDDD